MSQLSLSFAAVLFALVAPGIAQETAGKAADAALRGRQGTVIGVVDLDKAIDQYPKAIAERDKLQKLSQSLNERIGTESKRIDDLRAAISLLKEGSEAREAKEFELAMAMKNREGLAAFLKAQFDRELERFELAVYQDLEVAVAQVAKDRGVQIVLRVRPGPAEEGGRDASNAQQTRLLAFNRRAVWYASDEVDLTPALINLLKGPVDLRKPDPAKQDAGKADAGKVEPPAAPKPAGGGGE